MPRNLISPANIHMLNTRALTRPSPNDNLLKHRHPYLAPPTSGLGQKSTYISAKQVRNGTDDIFNHLNSSGGNYGVGLRNNATPLRGGGIRSLFRAGGAVPVVTSLVAPQIMPKVSSLVDFQPVPANALVTPPPIVPLRA